MNGIKLKELREKYQLTQDELAKELKVTRKTINSYENGANIPPAKQNMMNMYFEKLGNKMLQNTNSVVLVDSNNDKLEKTNSGVPYYDVDFSGGWTSEELFTTQKPSFYITNPEFFDADFACNLFGPSVANSIPSGSILGFKEVRDWKTYFPGGEFYGVVTKNNLRTVKIAKRIKGNNNELLLVPDPIPGHKERYEEETIPMDFIIGFYQVVAWAQFERIVM